MAPFQDAAQRPDTSGRRHVQLGRQVWSPRDIFATKGECKHPLQVLVLQDRSNNPHTGKIIPFKFLSYKTDQTIPIQVRSSAHVDSLRVGEIGLHCWGLSCPSCVRCRHICVSNALKTEFLLWPTILLKWEWELKQVSYVVDGGVTSLVWFGNVSRRQISLSPWFYKVLLGHWCFSNSHLREYNLSYKYCSNISSSDVLHRCAGLGCWIV